ncbi:hypothetical protein M9458_029595, partial [Cirrhinus mrigala]
FPRLAISSRLSRRLPIGLLLVSRILLSRLAPLRITFAPVQLMPVSRTSIVPSPNIPVCCCFDPACSTMYLSRPLNKSSRMDPLASRLTHSVTEYSVPTGSSSFTPGHSADMDTDRILCRIKQGPRTLEQYIREFLAIANYSTIPDCVIIEIFCDGINEPLKAKMRREGPRSSLAAFMDCALLCVGSPFTVGVADEERNATEPLAAWLTRGNAATLERAQAMTTAMDSIALMAATARVHTMAPTTEPVHKMAATAVPVRKMAAALVRAHKMAARMELHHVTAAIPEPYKVTAAFPESSQVAAVFPESDRPESSHVSSDLPEPRHPRHVSSDIPRSLPIMMASVLDPPLASGRAANIPVASTPARPTFKEVLPLASALPLMAVAIWCVWAARCAPEVTSAHKSAPEVTSVHKSAPEVTSGLKSAPEVPSGLKSAPEVTSGLRPAPEVPSGLKPAPELPSDHETDPEASPVGEAAPMPPEVSASAVEPPVVAVLAFKRSASLPTLSASSVPALPRSQSLTR